MKKKAILTLWRSNEELQVFYLIAWGFFLGLSITLLDIAATANFLHVHGVEALPKALTISGGIALGVGWMYTHFQVRLPYAWLSGISQVALVANFLAIYYGYQEWSEEASIYWAFYSFPGASTLTLLVFLGLFNRLFDISQIKFFGSRVNIGLTLGAIVVALAIPFLSPYLLQKTPYYVFPAAFSLIVGSYFLIQILKHNPKLRELQDSVQFLKSTNNYIKLARNNYAVLLGLFALASGCVIGLCTFSFYYIADLKYSSFDRLREFLSYFVLASVGAGFFLQVFLRRWLIHQYGMRFSLLLVPALIMVFSLIIFGIALQFGYRPSQNGFFIFFIIWVIFMVVLKAAHAALATPTFKLYFLPFEFTVRFDTQAKAEAIPAAIGLALAGLLLTGLFQVAKLLVVHFSIFLFVAGAFWIIVILFMHKAYREVLKNTLNRQQQQVNHARVSLTFLEELHQQIFDADIRQLPRLLNLYYTLDPVNYKEIILNLVVSENEPIQAIALKQAGELCLLEAISSLEELQKSKYFAVSKNAELILKVYRKLKGAEFRLEKLKYIEQLTLSKLVSERAFGALLSSYAAEEIKGKLLNKLLRDRNRKVRRHAVSAAAGVRHQDLVTSLIEKLGQPLYGNAAVASLSETGDGILPLLESAFYTTGQEEKIQLRIVQIYGRIGTRDAVGMLLKKLDYPNQNIISESLNAISLSGYTMEKEKLLQIKRELDEVCQALVWNMSVFLDLEREGASKLLLDAMKAEIGYNYDVLFQLLTLIYEPRSVELVRKNIRSGNPEEAEFAAELLEVFIAEEAKPIILPILNVSSYEEKINRLQLFFPTEPMPFKEAVRDLVQRDYKWINRWTKVCALQELSKNIEKEDIRILQASLVNPNPMIRETAALILYKYDEKKFEDYLSRFRSKLDYLVPEEVLTIVKLATLEESQRLPRLQWEMVEAFQQVPGFAGVPGLVLSELAKYSTINSYRAGDEIAEYESFDMMDVWVIHEGALEVWQDTRLKVCNKYELLTCLDYINYPELQVKLKAVTDLTIFKIPLAYFNEQLAFHEAIPKKLIKALREKKNLELVSQP